MGDLANAMKKKMLMKMKAKRQARKANRPAPADGSSLSGRTPSTPPPSAPADDSTTDSD